MTPYRIFEYAVNRPSAHVAVPERCPAYTRAVGPSCQRQCLAIVGQMDVLTHVPHLFGWSRPTTVLGAVRPVIVDSVNAVALRRARPHVGVEVIEGLPALADGDPTSTITWKVSHLRVLAPSLHVDPDSVFRTAGQSVLRGYAATSLCHQLKAQASTRCSMPRGELASHHDRRPTTVALANPLRLLSGSPFGTLGHDDQAAKPLVRQKSDTLRGHRASPVLGVSPPDVRSIAVAFC